MTPSSKMFAMVTTAILAAQPAHAVFERKVDAKASFGPLAVQLIDMDTSDGVTPWIEFLQSPKDDDTRAHVRASVNRQQSHIYAYGSEPWAPVFATKTAESVNQSVVSIASLLNPAGSFADGSSLFASGFGGNTGQIRSRILYEADVYAGGIFLLSANTKVVFSAMGTVSTALIAGSRDLIEYSGSVGLSLSGSGADGTGYQRSGGDLSIYGRAFHPPGGLLVNDYKSGNLEASFINLTGVKMSGTYGSSVVLDGQIAVPESSTYALMLFGMGILGIFSLQRQ